jgi:hypothetical protein
MTRKRWRSIEDFLCCLDFTVLGELQFNDGMLTNEITVHGVAFTIYRAELATLSVRLLTNGAL